MKKKVIIGIITGLALTMLVFACAFTIINRYVILDNFFEWFGGGLQMENVDRNGSVVRDYGNFQLIVDKNDNYLVRKDTDSVIIDKLYKCQGHYEDFYAISEYGYVFVSGYGPVYICLNEEHKDYKKIDASDVFYLESFEDFPRASQEELVYLRDKIIVKSGAYSVWN